MKEICNKGLGKIGASRVNNLAPPITVLEVKCADEYPQWKAAELKKRRWTFATTLVKLSALLTPVSADTDGRTFQFAKPGDLLRALRAKNITWVQRGEFFYDYQNTISLEYIRNVADNEITDPLFIDVLACRIAYECAESTTQSPAKQRNALIMYKDALEEAGRNNAFTLEPHQTGGDEAAYTWDNARLYPGWM
jgi:hypothetical protein